MQQQALSTDSSPLNLDLVKPADPRELKRQLAAIESPAAGRTG